MGEKYPASSTSASEAANEFTLKKRGPISILVKNLPLSFGGPLAVSVFLIVISAATSKHQFRISKSCSTVTPISTMPANSDSSRTTPTGMTGPRPAVSGKREFLYRSVGKTAKRSAEHPCRPGRPRFRQKLSAAQTASLTGRFQQGNSDSTKPKPEAKKVLVETFMGIQRLRVRLWGFVYCLRLVVRGGSRASAATAKGRNPWEKDYQGRGQEELVYEDTKKGPGGGGTDLTSEQERALQAERSA